MRRFLCTVVLASVCALQSIALGGQLPQAAAALGNAPEIAWKDARDYIGQDVVVVGSIVKANRSKGGHAFLDFSMDSKTGLTVFIKSDYYKAFPEPPEKFYRNKTVKVRGYVYEYNNALNIAATKPQDITIVPDDTPLPERAAPRTVASRPSPGSAITVACYNVLNLFDAHDDPYTNDQTTKTKPRPELEGIARTIRALDADVLALVEVENRGVLQQFVSTHLTDMGYQDVVLVEGNDVRGIDVAIVSRLPVGPVTSYRHLRFPDADGHTTRFQRDLLRARIEPGTGDPFDVFVVHFKSKGGQDNGGLAVRLAEARQARAVFDDILREKPDAAFLVCGDFNDYIDSEPLKALLGSGPTALTTFVSDLPPNQRITYNLPPHLSMIDFILASPAMTRRYVPRSYAVTTGGGPDRSGSDHNPVIAKFRLKSP